MNRDLVQRVINVSYDKKGLVKDVLARGYNNVLELYHCDENSPYFLRFMGRMYEDEIHTVLELLNSPVKSIDKEQLLKL